MFKQKIQRWWKFKQETDEMHCFLASTRNNFWRELRFQTQVAKITVYAVPHYIHPENQKWLVLEKTQVMFWVQLPNGMEQTIPQQCYISDEISKFDTRSCSRSVGWSHGCGVILIKASVNDIKNTKCLNRKIKFKWKIYKAVVTF